MAKTFFAPLKTSTVDNSSEFVDFVQAEQWGPKISLHIHILHRSGLRTNGTRAYSVPLFLKRLPLQFSLTKIYFLSTVDEGNGRPRKKLGYRTPEDLFDVFRDAIFTV